jgi:hypothetical protein
MHRRTAQDHPLLPEETLVETELLTLEDISIATTALAGPGGDDGEETTSLKLLLQRVLSLARGLETLGLLVLDRLRLLDLLDLLTSLGLLLAAEGSTVMGLVPLSEGRGIDLDDGGPGECVRADELVVARVVCDGNHTGLLGDAFGAP